MFRFNIFLFPLFVLYLNSSAQQAISNPAPNVSTDNIRYLFTGIDNRVTITTGCDGKYEVSISKGRIINKGNGHFIVNPPYDTSEVTIKVKAGQKEFDFVFNVRNIPDPEIIVGNYDGYPIYFKQTSGVRAFVKNFYYKTQFSVVSFDIEFSGPGFDDPYKHTNEGAQWDEVTKRAINKMGIGSKVYINKVRVMGPDGRIRLIYDDFTCILK